MKIWMMFCKRHGSPSQKIIISRIILLESVLSEMHLTKLSPFTIQKGISGIAGMVKDIKMLMDIASKKSVVL